MHTHTQQQQQESQGQEPTLVAHFLLLPSQLARKREEKRHLSLSLSLAGCPLLLLLCSYPCWAGISKTLHKVILYKYWPECQSCQGTYRGIPESENRQSRFFEYSAVREPSFPAP
jgi:hypothetical protein